MREERGVRSEIISRFRDLEEILKIKKLLERVPDCEVRDALSKEIEVYLNPKSAKARQMPNPVKVFEGGPPFQDNENYPSSLPPKLKKFNLGSLLLFCAFSALILWSCNR